MSRSAASCWTVILAALWLAWGWAGAATAQAPAARDRMVVALGLEPPNLDPTSGAAAAVDEVVYANVFEGLTRMTEAGTPAPALAESWQAAPDGLSWTFHLRRGVRFHDGAAFDADDVKFSLERIIAPGSTNAQKALFAPIQRVEVVDAGTARIVLSRPMAALPYLLAWGDAVMVDPATAAGNAARPIGTGPFRFHAWRRGAEIELRRNPGYWGPPARLGAVAFRFIGDPTAAYAAIRAGDVDAAPNYGAPETVARLRDDPGLRVTVGTSEGKVVLGLNNRTAPFDDIRVRRAVAHAIDRRALIDGAMFGFGEPIGSHYSPQAPGYVDLSGRYPHDPALARRLLAQAGYADGLDVTLRLPPRPYARRGGEIVAAQLAQVGIRVRIENLEWAQWLDQVFRRGQFDMTIVEHVEPMDYDIYGREDYYFGYDSAPFRALLARLDAAVDEPTRLARLGDIQRRIAEDSVNVFLWRSSRITVARAEVEGLWVNAPIAATDLTAAGFRGVAGGAETGERAAGARLPWGWIAMALGLGLVAYVGWRFGPAYLARRLGGHVLTLVAASGVVFVLMQVVPGDPAAFMMGLNATPDAVAALREQMGLEGPALHRYLAWVGDLAQGRFGTSYTYRTPVADLILERLAVSAPLALIALLLSLAIALPVGVLAAGRRGGAVDAGLMGAAQVGMALPNFWIALMLILLFSVHLGWFSAGGFPGWQAGLWPGLKALMLPALALAAPQAAILARVLRTALIDTLAEDYIRTARAKGLSLDQALWRHGLRNALIPVLTLLGLQFPFLLAGGIIVENVFALPGLGRLVFQAITQRDLIVVQGVVMVLVFAVVLVSLIIDMAYVVVDPRLRSRRA